MKTITLQELQSLASLFGYNLKSLRAVMLVETPNGGFLPDGRISILFERHVFHRELSAIGGETLETGKAAPDICSPKPGGYLGGAKEWDRMDKAILIDREAALKSASWGKGQIMGKNFKAAGFFSVEKMVEDFSRSEANQVKGMLHFIQANRSLDFVMKAKNPGLAEWVIFATGYNGKEYAKNDYHHKLLRAYSSL